MILVSVGMVVCVGVVVVSSYDGVLVVMLWLVLWGYTDGGMGAVVMRYLFGHGVDKWDGMGYNISM